MVASWKFPFGRYEGYALEEVPYEYLEHVLTWPDLAAPMRALVQEEVARRLAPRPPRLTPTALGEVLRDWRLRLALEHHPDRGGDEAVFRGAMLASVMLQDMLRERGLL